MITILGEEKMKQIDNPGAVVPPPKKNKTSINIDTDVHAALNALLIYDSRFQGVGYSGLIRLALEHADTLAPRP